MITFEPIQNGSHWSGTTWTITLEDDLAALVARVALGQHGHVVKILQETDCVAHAPISTALEGAIRLLTAHDVNGSLKLTPLCLVSSDLLGWNLKNSGS